MVGVNLPLSLGEVVGIVGACNCTHPEELSQEQFIPRMRNRISSYLNVQTYDHTSVIQIGYLSIE